MSSAQAIWLINFIKDYKFDPAMFEDEDEADEDGVFERDKVYG